MIILKPMVNQSNFSALINYAVQDFDYYNNHLIAAADIKTSKKLINATAFYSEKISYSLPISINLVSNSIIKGLLGDNYSIEIFSQEIPTFDDYVYIDSTRMKTLTIATMFSSLIFSAITLFSLHPSIESSSKLKHLQRMTGVSGFTYWGTMFIFDFIVYMFLVIFLMISLKIIDSALNLQIYHTEELCKYLLVFIALIKHGISL